MAEMVGETGRVIGIDHVPELVEKSRCNIRKGNSGLLDSGRLTLVTGDGRQGYLEGNTDSYPVEGFALNHHPMLYKSQLSLICVFLFDNDF